MIFGWDVSTSTIGLAVFDEAGAYQASRHLSLEGDTLVEKAAQARDFLVDVFDEFHPEIHYVEDRLAGFTRGFSSAQTLMRLGAFNEVFCWLLHDYCGQPEVVKMHPSTVKAVVRAAGLVIPKGGEKKELTLSFVAGREPSFHIAYGKTGKPKGFMYDRADAYVTGLAGIIRAR